MVNEVEKESEKGREKSLDERFMEEYKRRRWMREEDNRWRRGGKIKNFHVTYSIALFQL